MTSHTTKKTGKTTKKTGKFRGKSNSLGGGGRFAQLEAEGVSPGLVAHIGRKLYGKKMAKMAAKGKKRKEEKDEDEDED